MGEDRFRTIGTINGLSILLGISFFLDSGYHIFTGHQTIPADASYSPVAYIVMSLLELAFASVLLLTALRFVQLRWSAVNLYSYTVLLLIGYFVTIGAIWSRGSRAIASSVAAATAVSSMTTVYVFLFLLPFLYPIASVILLQLLKNRYVGKKIAVAS